MKKQHHLRTGVKRFIYSILYICRSIVTRPWSYLVGKLQLFHQWMLGDEEKNIPNQYEELNEWILNILTDGFLISFMLMFGVFTPLFPLNVIAYGIMWWWFIRIVKVLRGKN